LNNAEPNLLSAAWRYRWLVLVVTSLIVALAIIYQLVRPEEERFLAEATMVIQEPIAAESTTPLAPSSQYLGSQIEIIRSLVVAQAAASNLVEDGFEVTADELGGSITVIGSDESPLVSVVGQAPSADLAVLYVNAIAEGYREVSRTQATATSADRIERIEAQLSQIDTRLGEITEELAALISADPVLGTLREQADEALVAIAGLQEELVNSSGDTAASIRQEIADYRQIIATFTEVRGSSINAEQRVLTEEQTALVSRRTALQNLLDEVNVDAGLAPNAVALIQPATNASRISGLGLSRVLAVSLILGLALGVGLAYFLTVWRRSFTSRSEPEAVLKAPLLADVPDFEQEGLESVIPVRDDPRSAAAEAFRFAAASTEARLRARDLTSAFVVSSTLGHGKTTTTVNMAVAAAIHGRSVLVIDCDFGNQEAARLLAGPSHSSLEGVTDVIEGAATVEEATHLVDLGNGVTLSLMPRGTRPSLAASTLQSPKARDFFSGVAESYDLVLVDGPPMLQVAYASTLADLAEALVVIVEHQGSYSELVDLTDRLDLLQKPVLGYVYNRSPLRREMTMSEGSMMDILGDSGFIEDTERRRKRSI
jgi:Mrp family chromosome partitioning ATPase